MIDTVGGVVTALKNFRDFYGPRTSSFMTPGRSTPDIDADPFRRGFLDALTIRSELTKRLASLDERERAVVTLWYVADLPVSEVCKRLSLSRSHAYRIRDRALKSMTGSAPADIEITEATA
ncbi:MAG TPA: sigma factor-like helix-turn-helix DNA-binding protein [Actinomycetota bacterium]|jgi:DNA-directed RNA polymerase specialized sigma24 family protein